MASWADVTTSAADFAAATQGFFDLHSHKTIATLRRDGSPRISGIEATFAGGDLWFGGMWESRKALDLRRDPRFACTAPRSTPPDWKGDAKVSGRVVEIEDRAVKDALARDRGDEPPPGPYHLFRADIAEVVLVRLGEPRRPPRDRAVARGRGGTADRAALAGQGSPRPAARIASASSSRDAGSSRAGPKSSRSWSTR